MPKLRPSHVFKSESIFSVLKIFGSHTHTHPSEIFFTNRMRVRGWCGPLLSMGSKISEKRLKLREWTGFRPFLFQNVEMGVFGGWTHPKSGTGGCGGEVGVWVIYLWSIKSQKRITYAAEIDWLNSRIDAGPPPPSHPPPLHPQWLNSQSVP